MADNKNFISSVESIFKGMDGFIDTKTVVGDPVKIDNAIIIPLVDVSCGMAAGAFEESAKYNGGAGMSTKMSPAAVLVIQNGITKLVNVRSQDALTKILDLIPDLINKFKADKEISKETLESAKENLHQETHEY